MMTADRLPGSHPDRLPKDRIPTVSGMQSDLLPIASGPHPIDGCDRPHPTDPCLWTRTRSVRWEEIGATIGRDKISLYGHPTLAEGCGPSSARAPQEVVTGPHAREQEDACPVRSRIDLAVSGHSAEGLQVRVVVVAGGAPRTLSCRLPEAEGAKNDLLANVPVWQIRLPGRVSRAASSSADQFGGPIDPGIMSNIGPWGRVPGPSAGLSSDGADSGQPVTTRQLGGERVLLSNLLDLVFSFRGASVASRSATPQPPSESRAGILLVGDAARLSSFDSATLLWLARGRTCPGHALSLYSPVHSARITKGTSNE